MSLGAGWRRIPSVAVLGVAEGAAERCSFQRVPFSKFWVGEAKAKAKAEAGVAAKISIAVLQPPRLESTRDLTRLTSHASWIVPFVNGAAILMALYFIFLLACFLSGFTVVSSLQVHGMHGAPRPRLDIAVSTVDKNKILQSTVEGVSKWAAEENQQ